MWYNGHMTPQQLAQFAETLRNHPHVVSYAEQPTRDAGSVEFELELADGTKLVGTISIKDES